MSSRLPEYLKHISFQISDHLCTLPNKYTFHHTFGHTLILCLPIPPALVAEVQNSRPAVAAAVQAEAVAELQFEAGHIAQSHPLNVLMNNGMLQHKISAIL